MKRSTKNVIITGIFTISAAILAELFSVYVESYKQNDSGLREEQIIIEGNEGNINNNPQVIVNNERSGANRNQKNIDNIIQKDIEERTENNTILTIQNANTIQTNIAYKGNITSEDDINTYRFSVEKDGRTNIVFEHPERSSYDALWEVSLFNSKKDEVISLKSIGGVTNTISDYARVEAGDYYIMVNTNYYSNEEYTIMVNFEEENESYEKEENESYEKEENNQIGTANNIDANYETESDTYESGADVSVGNSDFNTTDNIILGTKVTGNIQTESDMDYYSFTLSETKDIYVSFEHEIIDSENPYWQIYIVSEADNQNKLQMDVKGNEAVTASTAEGLTPGNYYIKVQPYYFNDTDYSLLIE